MEASGDQLQAAFTPYYRQQYMLIEYRHLAKFAPSGVYVTPSIDSLNTWQGAIFLRQGLYRGGIFKFVCIFPEQ
jgi:ubiquitin-protein ligase